VKLDRVQRWPWIDRDLAGQLKVYCATGWAPETSVFNATLRDYFADAKDTTLIMRRLDRNDRAIAVGRQAVEVLSETFVAYMQSHFTSTPEMPDEQRRLGAITARRRLDEVLDAAARRLAGGGRLLDLLPQDHLADDEQRRDHLDAVAGRVESRVAVASPPVGPKTVPDGSARDISQTTKR
jgi:hypothetical protein